MTYKSIRDAIKHHEGRSLHCLSPLLSGEETPRTVFVSNDLLAIVTPPWPETWEGERHAQLRATLDSFTQGDYLAIGLDPRDKDACAIIARTDPVEAEVWDFRCLDPNPGIRVFGRFAERDTFVALTYEYREYVDWNYEIQRCAQAWADLFGSLIFKGRNLNDYLSYNYRAV